MIDWTACSDAELAALARALHEARFAEEPEDPLLWRSPLVVDLHVAALTEQRRRSAGRRRSGAAAGEDWLQWRNPPERSTVARRLAQDPGLLRLAREDGGRTLRLLLRPFILDDADVAALLAAACVREQTPVDASLPGPDGAEGRASDHAEEGGA